MFCLQVSLSDVGRILAEQITDTGVPLPSLPHVIRLHGPRCYTMLDLQSALETVTGRKPRINAVEPGDLLEFFAKKLPPTKAKEVVEMTVAVNGGGLLAEEMARPGKELNVVRGLTELVETLRRLAAGETSEVASGAF